MIDQSLKNEKKQLMISNIWVHKKLIHDILSFFFKMTLGERLVSIFISFKSHEKNSKRNNVEDWEFSVGNLKKAFQYLKSNVDKSFVKYIEKAQALVIKSFKFKIQVVYGR